MRAQQTERRLFEAASHSEQAAAAKPAVSSQLSGPIVGCRSERRVLGWPFGSILTHLHFPLAVTYDDSRIHPEVSASVGRAE